ncbi:MAG: DMT family transporter [Chloroflexota bacterium]
MPIGVLGVLLAVASAIAFGGGDFLGGSAARRNDAVRVAAVVQAVGLGGLFIVAVVVGQGLTAAALAFGVVAGVGGGVGLAALYWALTSGAMGLVTGLTGATASLVALGVDAAIRGNVPSPIQLIGVACALVAAWLVASVKGSAVTVGFIGVALLAGSAFGIYFLLLERAAETSPLWGLVAARAAGTAVLVGAIGLRWEGFRPDWRPLVGAGVLDAGASGLIVAALLVIPVGLAAAVSNANTPLVTMALAWLLLGERMPRSGLFAVGLACAGIALIALG